MDITILVLLILLNGAFAMSEIALVTARSARLKPLAENGDSAARAALSLGKNPTRFLSTIQIGITAIGILSGVFGEAALAGPLAVKLRSAGLAPTTASAVATGVVVVCITYFSIILGELVPKRIAQLNAESVARLVARPISLLARISTPFVVLLSFSTETVLRVLGKNSAAGDMVTEEDIQAIIAEGMMSGVLEKQEHDLVRNAFRLDDRQLASLMTPRNEIAWLDVNAPAEAILGQAVEAGHSRLPVCDGSLDTILGMVTTKRLLRHCAAGTMLDLRQNLLPPVYVPETLSGTKLLEHFRESGVQLVFVVDEYGNVVGLITLQDVLEALAGEFRPTDPEDVWAVQRGTDSWLLDGLIPILELKDRLELKTLPAEDKGRYNTLSGMLMWLMGSIPHTGDTIVWENWKFEVVDLDGTRIDKVLATPLEQ